MILSDRTTRICHKILHEGSSLIISIHAANRAICFATCRWLWMSHLYRILLALYNFHLFRHLLQAHECATIKSLAPDTSTTSWILVSIFFLHRNQNGHKTVYTKYIPAAKLSINSSTTCRLLPFSYMKCLKSTPTTNWKGFTLPAPSTCADMALYTFFDVFPSIRCNIAFGYF